MIAITMVIFWVVFCIYGIYILAPAAYFNWDTNKMAQKLLDLQYILKGMHENDILTFD
jgi:hypothetical protein